MALQLLVATLAGLLLLEARLSQSHAAASRSLDSESDEMVDFHPELLARWDDEAAYAQPRPCTRPRVRRSQTAQYPDDALAGMRRPGA